MGAHALYMYIYEISYLLIYDNCSINIFFVTKVGLQLQVCGCMAIQYTGPAMTASQTF